MRSAHGAVRPTVVPDASDPGEAERVWALLDLDLLAEAGFRPGSDVLAAPTDHPLLGYAACVIDGCLRVRARDGMCLGCRMRFERSGLAREEFVALGLQRDLTRWTELCRVCRLPGFERTASSAGLCGSCYGCRRSRGQTADEYVNGTDRFPPAKPRPSWGMCSAVVCDRVVGHPSSLLCRTHHRAWAEAGRPDLEQFRVVARPVAGELFNTVVLTGLSELARNEMLFGIQASIRGGRRSPVTVLRTTVQAIRESGCNSMRLLDLAAVAEPSRWFIAQALQALDRANRSRETERDLDVWDLTVWGHRGWISFVGATGMSRDKPARPIVQPWLRQAAKGWADEALCRLRTDSMVRKAVRGIGYWSEFLDRRPDQGMDPSALSRADITGFMQWMRSMERGGHLTPHNRIRFLAGVRQLLTEGRTQGLAELGGPLHRLPLTVAFRPGDIEDQRRSPPSMKSAMRSLTRSSPK